MNVEIVDLKVVKLGEVLSDMMAGVVAIPMFFVYSGMIIPVLDSGEDGSWQVILRNQH